MTRHLTMPASLAWLVERWLTRLAQRAQEPWPDWCHDDKRPGTVTLTITYDPAGTMPAPRSDA